MRFKKIFKDSRVLTSSIALFMISCSSTQYKMPNNYVDEPPILPNKMYSSSITYNKAIHEIEPEFEKDPAEAIIKKSIISLAHLLFVRKAVTENWELPMFPIPINATYLFGKNDFNKHNRIGYNKFYHVLNFGLTSVAYSSKNGAIFGAGANYVNTYVFNGIFKNEYLVGFEYVHGNNYNLNEFNIPMVNSLSYKMTPSLSPSVIIGLSYNYDTDEYNEPYFIKEEHQIRESFGIGIKYSITQWLRLNLNYSFYWEQFENYYMSNYESRDGLNYFWNTHLSFFW